jgi:hypothetical protein
MPKDESGTQARRGLSPLVPATSRNTHPWKTAGDYREGRHAAIITVMRIIGCMRIVGAKERNLRLTA